HGTIGRRNDSLRISEIVIRIGSQLDRPGPSSLSCQIEDDASQATAVGDRFVQPPVTRTTADRGKCFANQSKCGHGLLNATIASVHAGHVTHATVSSEKQDAARQCRFNSREEIETINLQFPVTKL